MGIDKIALAICFCLIVALAGFSAWSYLGAKGLESKVSDLESRTSNLEAQNVELNEKLQNYAYFAVPKGEEVTRCLILAVDDHVLVKFIVVGQSRSMIDFYISDPNGDVKVQYEEIGCVNYRFVCDEAGGHVLHFCNTDLSEDKLVILNYEVEHDGRTRVQEEALHLTKQHVWFNTSGSWAQAAIVIVNTGGKDVVLDKILVRGQECAWETIYYWRTSNVTVSDDLEVTSTNIAGSSFDITIQEVTRTFQQADDDLTLKPGWTIVIYVMNPDSIALNDVGITVGITVFTLNAQYYKETNVEEARASEQLQLGNPWNWDCTAGTVFMNVTNSGGGTVVLTAARVGDSSAAMSVTWSSDGTTTGANLAAGERACVQITRGSAFTAGVPYTFTVVTQRNNEFQTTGTAQAP